MDNIHEILIKFNIAEKIKHENDAAVRSQMDNIHEDIEELRKVLPARYLHMLEVGNTINPNEKEAANRG